ncbi:MAG: alginate export family protein [Novosphingobium sp.]
MRTYLLTATALAASIGIAHPAFAAPAEHHFGDPVAVSPEITIDPMLDGRLRYEHVDQPGIEADALTLRIRAGAELQLKPVHINVLVESEATLGLINKYNAYPYATPSSQRRTGYATIPDPQNIELNRVQVQYKTKALTVTLGRQRINLDDQRWVGNAGWRQNEQTFDAVRAEGKIGPVTLDGTYSIAQRTIFGEDALPRTAFDGEFVFLGAGVKVGTKKAEVAIKGFAYLLDYTLSAQGGALATLNAYSQTYGARATAGFALTPKVKLTLAASYARQSAYKGNPLNYGADYIAAEAGLAAHGVTLTGGYEKLGSAVSTTGVRRSVQTQMATLHKFNGWADLFLTTPANGLQDYYAGLAKAFPKVKALPGLNAAVIYHRFDSDFGGVHDGNEVDASLGFKVGRVTLLAKYADYKARGFGVNTKKGWLQAEFSY